MNTLIVLVFVVRSGFLGGRRGGGTKNNEAYTSRRRFRESDQIGNHEDVKQPNRTDWATGSWENEGVKLEEDK